MAVSSNTSQGDTALTLNISATEHRPTPQAATDARQGRLHSPLQFKNRQCLKEECYAAS